MRGCWYNTVNQTFVLSSKELGRLCPGHSLTFFLENHQNYKMLGYQRRITFEALQCFLTKPAHFESS